MKLFTCDTILTLFRFTCLGATILMIGFWWYVYDIEDESLCLVDYKAVDYTEDNELPVVSVCFRNPFLGEKLREIKNGKSV